MSSLPSAARKLGVNEVVLDASALLAFLNQETGKEVVAEFLPGAAVSAVNLSEVVAKLLEATMPVDAVRSALGDLGLDVRPFDAEMAYAAGALRTTTRKRGLSLGDRACLALALGGKLGVHLTWRSSAARCRPVGGQAAQRAGILKSGHTRDANSRNSAVVLGRTRAA
jgi:PIN domain nuclease of toxin-antitoxin system